MRSHLLIVVMLSLICTPALAFEFQVETGLLITEEQDDLNREAKLNLLGGRYYLNSIDTNSGPWAEARFLSKTSHVDLTIGKVELNDSQFSSEGNVLGLGYTHVTPSSLVLGVEYASSSLDIGNTFFTQETTGFELTIGKYLSADSGLELNIGRVDRSIRGFPGVEIISYELGYKKLFQFLGNQALSIQAAVEGITAKDEFEENTNTELEFAFKYYPNQRLGGGIFAISNSGDEISDEGVTVGLFVDAYVVHNISIGLQFTQYTAADDPNLDSTKLDISLGVRF